LTCDPCEQHRRVNDSFSLYAKCELQADDIKDATTDDMSQAGSNHGSDRTAHNAERSANCNASCENQTDTKLVEGRMLSS